MRTMAFLLAASATALVLSKPPPGAAIVLGAAPLRVPAGRPVQMGLLGRVKKIFARPEAGSTTAVDVTPAASSVADEIAKLTSVTKAGATQYPTAADIEEYCRDPESSGCDIEMIEKLMAEAAKLKEAQAKETAGYNQIQLNFMKPKPLRWSPDEQAVPSAE
ncbi:hypothetical protein EMIHUDRAFT_441174 [Emiliania huxleyi CCMP1516]|uniref:Uncharacterized protein n=3 Tax=Emiliania huxleyi TaxID=2903 RepID=A0A0D3KG70_EMIH1|nr:hypothetical protein EMIHUDRAFT_441174 [Emiliania huxleyi CCMP1516]EOD34755.1 hypothetical protein EMIHUDRAFT_441174 [Emiliania huxleyi CCMP1516]|eukprot:XP_005787184.1 hypothetical protein EMIHUDRAFT_441174 [Emiliania huxleyi CCMP1516]